MVDGVHSADSTVLAEDADCDGVVAEDDCDDEKFGFVGGNGRP